MRYDVVGVMSGTSLDGLDMLRVEIACENGQWDYRFIKADTLDYPEDLRARLARAVGMDGMELAQLHSDYGHFVGRALKRFTDGAGKLPAFAAVHGHTVFHRPDKGFTLQIGDGAAIAAESGLTVVNNFRTTDLSLGGQGAPLVPIGDELLFSRYDFCLNLGGIANISYKTRQGIRTAFDISVCNMALNRYAAAIGLAYDKDGENARKGRPIAPLLAELNNLAYYRQSPPKSLGFEWFRQNFLPVVHRYEDSSDETATQDILSTLTEHIARQIAEVCRAAEKDLPEAPSSGRAMLITGGGALNTFLIERITALSGIRPAPADKDLINYKEALIFALLGVLRIEKRINCLASVTGAVRDNIGGAVYLAV